MLKSVKKRFDIPVTVANQLVSRTFELDKDIKVIKGILLTSNKDEQLYYRGTQKIEINKEELFPDNYESKLLMSGVNVPPTKRYYVIGSISTGNSLVKVDYTDTDDGRTPFSAYRVSLYLDCEREELT
jgi:hypothetical protein